MSFDYDKLKEKAEVTEWWASYADLWAMLSIVFLLMYVATSLRSGTQGFRQELDNQSLAQKNMELEEQLRVYSTLRDQTLEKTSEEEQKVYEKLISKLDLLQEEAKNEKNDLRKKAKENEEKEFALNQYQQIVRNIIDTNVLAKASIQNRDKVITSKKKTITENKQEIAKLNADIAIKENTIEVNEQKINHITQKLDVQIKKLHSERNAAKISSIAMEKTVQRLREASAREIQNIQTENDKVREKLAAEIRQTESKYRDQLESLRAENRAKLESEKQAFHDQLKKQRLSAEARAQKLEAFKNQSELRARELEGNLSELAAKVNASESQLSNVKKQFEETQRGLAQTRSQAEALGNEVTKTKSELEGARGQLQHATRSLAQVESAKSALESQNSELGTQLTAAKERLAARKNLISQIKRNFAQKGIKASVDEKSGDVLIDFGEEYFESGRADLKPGMIQTLKKMIPTYSESLFKDPVTAEKISNIEIIGFASSTYKGRYVNPSSLKPENQEAINYNLKLSFDRANSIFKHVFDPSKMTYEHQQRLLPMVKVVGRGFLPDGKQSKDLPDNMPTEKFCKQFNCEKAQRVIIKFNLKD